MLVYRQQTHNKCYSVLLLDTLADTRGFSWIFACFLSLLISLIACFLVATSVPTAFTKKRFKATQYWNVHECTCILKLVIFAV